LKTYKRAYIFDTESENVSMTVLANQDSPAENLCMVFKRWDSKQEAIVSVDGNQVECKQGIVRDTDGSYTLLIWIDIHPSKSVDIEVKS